ncbi:hypothetical protein [Reyranella sp.]|uniref:hypothetical protein n=1 Tax=Reyranella sp. TaxID=1929291 RepID=UPI003D0F52EB
MPTIRLYSPHDPWLSLVLDMRAGIDISPQFLSKPAQIKERGSRAWLQALGEQDHDFL